RAAGAMLTPFAGLTLSGRAESGARLTDSGAYRDRSAAGATAALALGPFALSLRGEGWTEGAADHGVLAGASATLRLAERFTLAARGFWSHALFLGDHVIAGEAALTAAWRSSGAAVIL